MITGDLDAALAPEIARLAPAAAVISYDGAPQQDGPQQDGPQQDGPQQDGPQQDGPQQDAPRHAAPERAGPAATGSAGTWRPGPPGQQAAPGAAPPGTYATTVAFRLGGRPGTDPAGIAAALAEGLRRLDWVEAASVTGAGYLTVTVTAEALATLAVRITQAGPACARGTALAGTPVTAPRHPCLTAAPTWREAHRRLVASITGRLAEAAGADVHWTEEEDAKRLAPANSPPSVRVPGNRALTLPSARLRHDGERRSGQSRELAEEGASLVWLATDENAARGSPGAAALPGPPRKRAAFSWGGIPAALLPGTLSPASVADAVAFAGADAITFALARVPPASPARVDMELAAAHHLGNPAYAVQYAHAHAASALRQAADLGLGLADAAGFQPRLVAHPSEQALQYELSWLPERVAGAARRGQPDVLARYLERLAWVYLGCQQNCPAVWPGMPARAPASAERLWLAAAARTALGAGLGLLGVSAPDRL